MCSGTVAAPALSVLVHELKVATGSGPAPKVPSGSHAPASRSESSRAVSRQISRVLSEGRPSWKPRLTAPIQASTAALPSALSSCGSRVLCSYSTDLTLVSGATGFCFRGGPSSVLG